MADGHGHAHGRTHRHDHEAEVYDARADAFLATATVEDLRVDASRPPFPNAEHEDFLSFALAKLGDVAGRRVLEIGCGTGALAVYLALQGAEVVAVDVSEGNLRVGRARAEASGVGDRVRFVSTPVELLDEPDASFDAVIGNQVLHHVELGPGMRNVRRMLAPGGRAVFCEPVLFLPEWTRRVRNSSLVTKRFPSRADTPDERSLSQEDVRVIGEPFERKAWYPFQLTCRLRNFVGMSDATFARLRRLDRTVLRKVPAARSLCRYIVMVLDAAPSGVTNANARTVS